MKLRQDIFDTVKESEELKFLVKDSKDIYDRSMKNKYTEEFKQKLTNQIIDSIKFIYDSIEAEAKAGKFSVFVPMVYIESAYNDFVDDSKYLANSEGYRLSIPYILEYFTQLGYDIKYVPDNNPDLNTFRIYWEDKNNEHTEKDLILGYPIK